MWKFLHRSWLRYLVVVILCVPMSVAIREGVLSHRREEVARFANPLSTEDIADRCAAIGHPVIKLPPWRRQRPA